jgi:hypothetical protein
MGSAFLRRLKAALCLWIAAAAALLVNGEPAQAGELCPQGWWADAMVGTYHIRP